MQEPDADRPGVLTLDELCRRAGGISRGGIEHLRALVSVWQLIADLAFADLLLLAPIQGEPDGDMLVLAQIRPDTAQTLYPDDHVGTALLRENAPEAVLAMSTGSPQAVAPDARGVERYATPIRPPGEDAHCAVLLRDGMPFGGRSRVSVLEQAYAQATDALDLMIVDGVFPFPGMADWEPPRVGDGLMVLARSGVITFASPNAIAAHKRLGIRAGLVGMHVQELPGGQAIWTAMTAGVPFQGEVEVGGGVVNRRLVPLRVEGGNSGGILLVQDVTEVRRRDRMVLYKDAVIREIHHRIKNNLQTIASLLRLQARRLQSEEGKAALEEMVLRISAFAFVHETLSQSSSDLVDFSEVLRGVLRMLEDALDLGTRGITTSVEGSVGELPAVVATPLAQVITELVQNSAEHGFAGRKGGAISVKLALEGGIVRATVADDGRGFPEGFGWDAAGLGLQIVRALIEGELKGSITFATDRGANVTFQVPLSEAAI